MRYSAEKRRHDGAIYEKLTGEHSNLMLRNTCCHRDWHIDVKFTETRHPSSKESYINSSSAMSYCLGGSRVVRDSHSLSFLLIDLRYTFGIWSVGTAPLEFDEYIFHMNCV
jgi:hypothetical protein